MMAEMGAKLNVFKDPYLDRATETEDLMAKIRGLDGEKSIATGSPNHSHDGLSQGGNSSGQSPGSFHGTDSDRYKRASNNSLGNQPGGRKDHLNDLMRISGDLKAKADRSNDLRRKRDNLDSRNMKRQGIAELRTGLHRACGEYDKMADDL